MVRLVDVIDPRSFETQTLADDESDSIKQNGRDHAIETIGMRAS